MAMRVAVLMGGTSAEREVSLRSGDAVSSALRRLGHEVTEVDVGSDIAERMSGLRSSIDVAFVALHGRMGEDGTIQGLLEILRIPYTGSGVMASALAINKNVSKQVFRASGIPVVEDMVASAAEVASAGIGKVADEASSRLGFPCMVKPNCEGSTVGARKARDRVELEQAISEALAYDDLILIERFIEGREVTVGLVGGAPTVLPVLEVVASKGVYDYECKYTQGMTEYIVPAIIPEELACELRMLSVMAHSALCCEGLSRVDFMLDAKMRPYCLEVNTIPGMTSLSLIPKAAAAAGLSFDRVVEMILETARLKIRREGGCHGAG